jgi:ATP phosphoribosyltransferase
MLKIGIPNRSSLLHVAGIGICMQAGLVDAASYNPPCLHYYGDSAEILLSRCEELCKLFEENRLDVILTGFDYAMEQGCDVSATQTPCDVFRTAFAVMGKQQRLPPSPTVVTKFPLRAAARLVSWGIEYKSIRPMAGGVEGLCEPDNDIVAFDVVCTGGTVASNGLRVYRQDAYLPPVWLSRGALPDSIQTATAGTPLMLRLQEFYRRKLEERDVMMAGAVNEVLAKSVAA